MGVVTDWSGLDVDKVFHHPSNKEMQEWFFKRLYERMHVLNMSLMICWYGKHRSGKSLAAIYFSHILDPTFAANLEQRVVYTPRDFTVALKQIREAKIVGAAVIFDEGGITHSSQKWYEQVSKILNSELQAMGYLRPFVSFVTQDVSFLNSQVRKLATAVYEVTRASNAYATIKPMYVSSNPFTSKIYRHFPIMCCSRDGTMGNVIKITSLKVGLPPKDIMARYIVHSQKFKDQLLEQAGRDIDTLTDSNEEKGLRPTLESIIDLVVKDPGRVEGKTSRSGHVILNADLIAHEYHVTARASGIIKRQSEKILNNK